MDEREERIAKNETVFRAANREIEHAEQEEGGGTHRAIEVLCECGRPGCSGLIQLDHRGVQRRSLTGRPLRRRPGTRKPELEKVVEERADYLIVDKFGEAEEIAESEPG